MSWFNFWYSTFDCRIKGFTRTGEVNPVKRKCRCGYTISFIIPKRVICPNCKHYVYPTDKEEFRERLKKELKNEKEKRNGL